MYVAVIRHSNPRADTKGRTRSWWVLHTAVDQTQEHALILLLALTFLYCTFSSLVSPAIWLLTLSPTDLLHFSIVLDNSRI